MMVERKQNKVPKIAAAATESNVDVNADWIDNLPLPSAENIANMYCEGGNGRTTQTFGTGPCPDMCQHCTKGPSCHNCKGCKACPKYDLSGNPCSSQGGPGCD